MFSVIPAFQDIFIETERAYTLGLFFSAISAASVAIERMLNLARIDLHAHHKPIKELWGKDLQMPGTKTSKPFKDGPI